VTDYDYTPLFVEFELVKEGADTFTYRETYPRGVCKTLYITRLAAHYHWGGKPPKRIRATMERIPE
jgi:hypothetical protein